MDPEIAQVGNVDTFGEQPTITEIVFTYCIDDEEIEDKSECMSMQEIEEWYLNGNQGWHIQMIYSHNFVDFSRQDDPFL